MSINKGKNIGRTGATGPAEIPLFRNVAQRDQFFDIASNRLLLEVDLPVVVNEGNTITIFIWTGVSSPATYDPDLFQESPLNAGPGSLFLGKDGCSLSSAGKTVNFFSAYGDSGIILNTVFTNEGSLKGIEFQYEKRKTVVNADVFDTQLSTAPFDFSFTAVGTTYTTALNIRPATTGTLIIKGFAGTDTSAPIVEDISFVIGAGDIGNIVTVPVIGLLVVPTTELFLTFDGIDLFGGVQTSGSFSGQTKPFLESLVQILNPVHLVNEEDVAQYPLLNRDHMATTVKTGGVVVNSLPTATTDTFTDATFTAGIPSGINPSVPTVGTGIFSAGDIVLISHSNTFVIPSDNDGVYEVLSHASNILTVKGVGTTPKVEDFTRDQFMFQESSGTITKVNVSVLKLTDTEVLAGFGSTTPIVFNGIGGDGSFSDSFDTNDAQFPSSNPAVADSRNGHAIASYDDTVAENLVWKRSMSVNYVPGNIAIDIDWVAETATTGGVTWGIEIERNAPGGNDIDSDSFAAQQTGTSTTNATSGVITRTTITLTQAEADAIEALDSYRIRLQRVVGDGGDTMVGDAQVEIVGVRNG